MDFNARLRSCSPVKENKGWLFEKKTIESNYENEMLQIFGYFYWMRSVYQTHVTTRQTHSRRTALFISCKTHLSGSYTSLVCIMSIPSGVDPFDLLLCFKLLAYYHFWFKTKWIFSQNWKQCSIFKTTLTLLH